MNNEKITEMKIALGKQLLYYITENTEDNLVWTDTKTHLIELVQYIYDNNLLVDEYGISLSKMRIAQMACSRFQVTMPRNLSTYRSNINNNQGRRSKTLLSMAMYIKEKSGGDFTINKLICSVDIQKDIQRTHRRT